MKCSVCANLSFLLQQYSPLLAAFTTQGQSELTLLLKIQEYCYDNIHFMKAFQKIVVLFYKGNFCGVVVLVGCFCLVVLSLFFFLRPVFAECFSPGKTFREDQCSNIALHRLKNVLPLLCKDGAVKCNGGCGCPWHMGRYFSRHGSCLSTRF